MTTEWAVELILSLYGLISEQIVLYFLATSLR